MPCLYLLLLAILFLLLDIDCQRLRYLIKNQLIVELICCWVLLLSVLQQFGIIL